MQTDLLHRFIFDNTPIRGNLIQLDNVVKQALQHHDYPQPLQAMLGELMAACALLSSTLKIDGALVLQIQGSGALQLLVVECTSALEMRATAKFTGALQGNFKEMIGDGRCVITLEQNQGESYQGIVPIEGESIADMLKNYMIRSQQIDTGLWLTSDGERAAGMLIQKLPEQAEQDADAWNRIGLLADTVTGEELQTLDAASLLTRLFHEEEVRLFEPHSTRFHCSCTQKKVANMLNLLGKAELENILQEQGSIEVNCDFCNKQYQFDAVDVGNLLADHSQPVSSTRH